MSDLNVKKLPGIGPASQPGGSKPFNEDTPLSGPSFWQTGGSHGDNDRQARFHTDGQYWAQQPTEGVGPNHYEARYMPTSDTTGSNDFPEGRAAGRYDNNAAAPGMPPAVDNC